MPTEDKAAFALWCKEEGISMGAIVRERIEPMVKAGKKMMEEPRG